MGKTFTWKAESGLDSYKHYGFIAQEVQKVVPDLVKAIGCHYFDKDDNVVNTLAADVCGKRLSSCKKRFGENGVLPFGSFPTAGKTQ